MEAVEEIEEAAITEVLQDEFFERYHFDSSTMISSFSKSGRRGWVSEWMRYCPAPFILAEHFGHRNHLWSEEWLVW